MDIKLLFLVIFVLAGLIIIFYNYLYQGVKGKYELINKNILNMTQEYEKTIVIQEIIKRNDLSMPGYGEGFVIQWDMYLPNVMGEQNWNTSYSIDKPLLRIGNTPQIYYNPKYNTLKVKVKYSENSFYAHEPIIELKNIPLQKWNNYIVVINNNKVKIYLNGKQVINKVLNNVIILDYNDIIIGQIDNNIQGQLKNATIYFRPMTHTEVKKQLLTRLKF